MTEAQRENPSRRLRVFTQSPAEFFDEGLRQIEKTRMAGLPILNPKLVVRSAGWRRWGNDWIGVVTTPSAWHLCLRVKRRMGRRSCRPHPNH